MELLLVLAVVGIAAWYFWPKISGWFGTKPPADPPPPTTDGGATNA